MARPEKVAVVEEIRAKLEEADAAVLTEYRGLTVDDLAELRASLRQAGAEYKIFKNTLARRAASDAGYPELAPMLDGPTAITFVRGDAVVAAKALRDYAKSKPTLIVKGGVLGERMLEPEEVAALAEIEPREVLLARLAGGFQAPLVKAAGLFSAFTRNFAYGVKALIDQRVAGGEAPPAEQPEDGGEEAASVSDAEQAPGEASGEMPPVEATDEQSSAPGEAAPETNENEGEADSSA